MAAFLPLRNLGASAWVLVHVSRHIMPYVKVCRTVAAKVKRCVIRIMCVFDRLNLAICRALVEIACENDLVGGSLERDIYACGLQC
jgi:hypothetical protein